VRIGIIACGLALLAASFTRAMHTPDAYALVMGGALVVVGVATSALVDAPNVFGQALVQLAIFFVVRVRFAHAVGISAFNLVVWAVLLAASGQAAVVAANAVLLLFIAGFGALSSWTLHCAMREDFITESRLAREEHRAGELLDTMLPPHVLERLRGARDGDATGWSASFDERCVSVMFIQVADFERVATEFAPGDFVALLDRLWGLVDAVAERHSVTKLETVGKEYVACAGLGGDRLDHASALVAMALDVLAAVQSLNADEAVAGAALGLAVRIGVHTGP